MPKNTQITTTETADIAPEILEKALIGGDLSALTPAERISYYRAICASLSLNALTRPFEYITLDGKLTLYAKRDCTEQLRRRDGITVTIVERKTEDGLHIVTAKAKNSDGREDEAIGAVGMVEPQWIVEWNRQTQKKEKAKNPAAGTPLSPDERAKRMMVAETKAKRRVTLSLAGLGIPDESEIEGVVNDTPDEPRTIQAITENAAETAKVIEAGGTVTVIEPKKTRAPRTKKEEPAPVVTPWQELECHVGLANGPLLGRKMGDIHRKGMEYRRDKWMPKLVPVSTTEKDTALVDAVNAYFAANPEPEPEPPKETPAPEPEPKFDYLHADPKEPASDENPLESDGSAEDASEPEQKMEWRSIVVNMPNAKKGNGYTLGQFADSKRGFLDVDCGPNMWFRSFLTQGIPKIKAKGNLDVKDKVLINAIRAACDELQPFDDVTWLDGLNEEKLRAEITRRFDAAEVGYTPRGKVLSEVARLANLTPDSKELLRYALGEWDNVETLIEGEK